jgi:acetyl esterase/lipase
MSIWRTTIAGPGPDPMRFKSIFLPAFLCTGLSACSTTTQLEIFSLQVTRSGYDITRDVAYGPLPEQRLDVYRPDPEGDRPAPILLFLHGGTWTDGDKAGYRFLGQALTSRGFIVLIADFRQYPAVKFPIFLEDAAKALAFAHAHAAEFGGDPANLFVMGHSSGAHMAAMVALDGRYLAKEGLSPAILKGAIGLAGPYDFLPFTEDDVKDIFSPANGDLAQTQPINFVAAGAPAFLLLHGADDHTVRPTNTQHLAARLTRVGAVVDEHIYPDMQHLGVVLDLAPLFRGRAPVLDDIDQFVRAR